MRGLYCTVLMTFHFYTGVPVQILKWHVTVGLCLKSGKTVEDDALSLINIKNSHTLSLGTTSKVRAGDDFRDITSSFVRGDV